MDHFAPAGDELAVAQRQKTFQRNFQGYSTRGGADIYAFGMSSISQAEGSTGRTTKSWPITTPPWTRASCRCTAAIS